MKLDYSMMNHWRTNAGVVADDAASLMDEIHKVGLCRRDGSALRSHSDCIKNWRFRTALVAPWQSGKSLTTAIVCDGREVSPVGSGLKTSACAIECHPLDGGDEYAIVDWRLNRELLLNFPLPILKVLAQEKKDSFRDLEEMADSGRYSLDKPADRKLLTMCLASVLKTRASNQNPEDAERLFMSWLVLKHYEGVAAIKAKTGFTLDEARCMAAYPSTWERDLANGEHSKYSSQEVAFLYIKRLRLHLRSETLSRLRTVFVDCPGRGISPVDNLIARQAVVNSTAVIFLLGERGTAMGQLGIAELRWLLHELQVAPKRLFFAYNARHKRHHVETNLLPTDLGKINDELGKVGSAVKQEDVPVYNALLDLRLAQHQNFDRLPTSTIKALADSLRSTTGDDGSDVDLARQLIDEDIIAQAQAFLRKGVKSIDDTVVKSLLAESGWPKLVAKVGDFVAQEELPSFKGQVLEPIEQELGAILTDLEFHVRAPKLQKDAWQEEKAKACVLMANIQLRLKLLRDAADTSFSLSAEFAATMREEVAARIEHNDLDAFLEIEIKKKHFAKEMPASIHEAIQSSLSNTLVGWLDAFKKGDTDSSVAIRNTLDSWTTDAAAVLAASAAESALLKSMPYSSPAPTWASLTGEPKYDFTQPVLEEHPLTEKWEKVEDGVAKKTLNGLRWFLGVGKYVGEVVVGLVTGGPISAASTMDHQQYTKQIGKIVPPAKEEAKKHAGDLVSKVVKHLQDALVAAFDVQMEKLKQELDERIEQGDSTVGVDLSKLKERATLAESYIKKLSGSSGSPGARLKVLLDVLVPSKDKQAR